MNMKSQLLRFSRFILLVTSALLVFSCNKAGENEYIITGTRHILSLTRHITVIEVASDSTNDVKTYVSNPEQNKVATNYGVAFRT